MDATGWVGVGFLVMRREVGKSEPRGKIRAKGGKATASLPNDKR